MYAQSCGVYDKYMYMYVSDILYIARNENFSFKLSKYNNVESKVKPMMVN